MEILNLLFLSLEVGPASLNSLADRLASVIILIPRDIISILHMVEFPARIMGPALCLSDRRTSFCCEERANYKYTLNDNGLFSRFLRLDNIRYSILSFHM